jgi:ornithine cyclodeaminase/alanine dehydrogenase-like protein (mu-crystallin family)
MIFISAQDSEKAFEWRPAIDRVLSTYAAEAEASSAPGRLIAAAAGRSMRCMPAITPGGRYMGTKHLVKARGGQVTYLICLFDQDDGRLAFILDAVHITAMRTAATSAAALTLLDPHAELDLAVLGSSMEARAHVEALADQFTVRRLRVYSPSAENRASFAAHFERALGISARAADSPEQAVGDASHVVTAARSHGEAPILYGSWLARRSLVVSIGSTLPSQRELDVSVIERAGLIVADEPRELALETGDMLEASARHVAFQSKLFSLQALARGELSQRLEPRPELVLFKSLGSGRQDVAVAEMVAERCSESGLGTELPVALTPKGSVV